MKIIQNVYRVFEVITPLVIVNIYSEYTVTLDKFFLCTITNIDHHKNIKCGNPTLRQEHRIFVTRSS